MPAVPLSACPPLSADRAVVDGGVASETTLAGARTFVVGADARRWFAVAVGSLVVAGLLSLSVVLGRLPGVSHLIDDPLFFKRCLVVHVVLALVVWFYAFIAGLAAVRCGRSVGRAGRVAYRLSVGGTGAMLVGALMRGAQPVLANYLPVIDHPLFLGGLAAFFVGALIFLLETLSGRAAPRAGGLPADAAVGLQAAVIAFVLAGATWVATRAAMPDGLDTWTRFEFSAWGAGHVLQVANVAAMVAVWLWLLSRATGRAMLSETHARWLFTLLVAPHFAMPLLTARGAMDALYHTGATQLMRWGIFPIVSVVLVLGMRHLWRYWGDAKKAGTRGSVERGGAGRPALPDAESTDAMAGAARAGLLASMGLTTLGFVLGACIRSSTTLVPAHYHASLGGVTVAFMTAAYLVCAAVRTDAATGGCNPSPLCSARRQLALFGIGQAVFALGFAVGGLYGLGRKAYAGEQHVRSTGEVVGLGIMGVGGLVATIAGLWFLFLVLREMRGWWARRAAPAPVLFPSSR